MCPSFHGIFVQNFLAFIVAYVKRRVSAIKQVFLVLHHSAVVLLSFVVEGSSDGAMVLGKLPVPGRPTNLD